MLPPGDHTFAIGIDPGEHTGLAVFNRKENRLAEIYDLDFWRAYWHIINNYPPTDCRIYVECTKHLKIHRRHYWAADKIGERVALQKGEAAGKKAQRGTVVKIARDAGGTIREAELLMQGLTLAGYQVIRGGVAQKDEWTEQFFQRITKYMGKVTQHERDATCMCWMR
jgi:hypothetical protein